MKNIYYLLILAVFITGCNEDGESVRNDFELGFNQAVNLANGATFSFTTESDLPISVNEFQINEPGLANNIDNVLLDGSALATEQIGGSFQLTLQPENEGFNNTTVILDNTVSQKFINFQFLVESGEITFAVVSYTTNTGESMLVTNYEESIFKFDYFTTKDVMVFIENGTPEGKELYPVRAQSNELSYSISGGGTDVFRFFVEDL